MPRQHYDTTRGLSNAIETATVDGAHIIQGAAMSGERHIADASAGAMKVVAETATEIGKGGSKVAAQGAKTAGAAPAAVGMGELVKDAAPEDAKSTETVEEKAAHMKRAAYISWPFAISFVVFLPATSIMIQWLYAPRFYTAKEFSYLVGTECTEILGREDSAGLSLFSVRCINVFIAENATGEIRSFMEIFVGTMLFYVFTIHSSLKFIVHDLFKKLAQVLFCGSVVVEALFLHGLWIWYTQYDAVKFDSIDDNPGNLLGPELNNPAYPLIHTVIIESTVIRGGILFGTALCMAADTVIHFNPSKVPVKVAIYEGCWDIMMRRIYVLSFVVVTCVIGFTVLQFYVPPETTPLVNSYRVGTACPNVQGLSSNDGVCDAADAVSMPCEDLQGCIRRQLTEKNLDELESFYTAYVTVLIFYVLTLVEGLSFYDLSKALHVLWYARSKLGLSMAIFLEGGLLAFVLFSQLVYIEEPDLENDDPGAWVTATVITSVTVFRMVACVLFYAAYFTADRDPREKKTEPDDLEA